MQDMIEQLWYTWSSVGIGYSQGFQVRAASRGLQDTQSERMRTIDRYLRYNLPQGSDPYTLLPEQAPLSLAFINTGTENILVYKTFVGKDQFGRVGNFFTHLLAGLPDHFTAREAIQYWCWPQWQNTDTLDQSQLELPQIPLEPFEMTPAPADITEVQELLSWTIQAYLSLQGQQRIYLAAPPHIVANLLWMLTRCLPRQLFHNLTFSTYEHDVLKANGKLIGTCWLPAQDNTVPQELPYECYEGLGLAINYFTGKRSNLVQNPLLLDFTQFVTQCIIKRDISPIRTFIEKIERIDPRDVNIASFLQSYRLFASETQKTKMSKDDLNSILEDPALAALSLPQDYVQNMLIKTVLKDHKWAKDYACNALTTLRARAESEARTPILEGLQLLTGKVFESIKTGFWKKDVPSLLYLLELLAAIHPPASDPRLWKSILDMLTENRNLPTYQVYPWNIRASLLQQASSIASQINEKQISPWLEITWDELKGLLTLPLPPRWSKLAIGTLLSTTNSAIPTPAIRALEQNSALIEALLQNYAREPAWKLHAVKYFGILLESGYQDKWKLLNVLLPELKSDDSTTEAILVAARLKPLEFADLLEKSVLPLLSYRKLPPTAASFIEHYMSTFDVNKVQRAECISLLEILSKIAPTSLSNVSQSYIHGWLTITKFMEQPGIQKRRLDPLSKAIQLLPPAVLPALAEWLMSILATYIDSDLKLIHLMNRMSTPLQETEVQLLTRLTKAAGEDYGRYPSTDRLLPYILVALDIDNIIDFEEQTANQETVIDDLLKLLFKHADKEAFAAINRAIEKWPEDKHTQWQDYLRRRATRSARSTKTSQNTSTGQLSSTEQDNANPGWFNKFFKK